MNSYLHLIDRKIVHAKRYVFRNIDMMSANGSDICLHMCVCVNCEDTSVYYSSINFSVVSYFNNGGLEKNDRCEHCLNPVLFLSHPQHRNIHICQYNGC